jgi:hypothetical protein
MDIKDIEQIAIEKSKELDALQEKEPETKIETEIPTEEQKGEKPEEEPIREEKTDIKTEQKIEKNIKTIPLSAHIRAEKEYKAKIAELTGELERLKQANQQPTPKELEELFDQYGIDESAKQFFKDLIGSIENKYSDKFKTLDEYQSKTKEQQEQQELVEYVDKQVGEISDLIQKEHGNNAPEVLNKLKIKILQEGLYATPPELVYKGFDEFKPIKKKMSAETPSPSPKTEIFDKENATFEDVKSGKLSAEEFINIMRKKHGQE